ncbi:PQQ-binding-like beta-propeller repeat protein [Planosporangium sp. 12N6]|uniref:outer membrane protein assembly factor BamB family protein n=1 Tax=Planosporangium spinosum TaxID=3402278 RepID=UPI003CF38A1F
MHAARHRRALPARLLTAAAATVVGVVSAAAPAAATQGPRPQWSMGGYDLANSRWNPLERSLRPSTVGDLAVKWAIASGDVSATPAVVDGAVYVPDWNGTFRKLDARTGRVLWSRSVAEYTGVAGTVSRTSPVVVGGTVYIGTQLGARLLAIDTRTGDLRWSTVLDEHPAAVLTQSPVVHNGVVYQGVSSQEEAFAADPAYPCCTFRGSMAAVDARTGAIRWKTPTIPDQGPGTDIFSGAAVWGSTPAVDPASGTVYITTGNNYEMTQRARDCQAAGGKPADCLPAWNRINSIIALDLRTGAVKWSTGQDRFDAWNVACIPGLPPNNCPPIPGPDHDFGDGAHLFTIAGPDAHPRRAVGAGQKSGEYWMLDATTGAVLWSAAAGPGSALGGIEWGSASDGRRIFFTETNYDRLPYRLPDGQTIDYSSFGALDVATGRVLWQVPEPHGGMALGAVTTAGGVVYAGSLNGYMYAIDAATGKVRWEHQAGGSSAAGPAVVDGSVYWGNGYARFGTPGTTFYAFAVPRRP